MKVIMMDIFFYSCFLFVTGGVISMTIDVWVNVFKKVKEKTNEKNNS